MSENGRSPPDLTDRELTGAVNQAVKAIAIARGYLEPDGIDTACVPAFAELEIEGQERTAVRLEVFSQ
jgi:stage V sporulation protein S